MSYFSHAKAVFKLNDSEIDTCMAKVDEMFVAKANNRLTDTKDERNDLTGKKESYATVILNIVTGISEQEIVDMVYPLP